MAPQQKKNDSHSENKQIVTEKLTDYFKKLFDKLEQDCVKKNQSTQQENQTNIQRKQKDDAEQENFQKSLTLISTNLQNLIDKIVSSPKTDLRPQSDIIIKHQKLLKSLKTRKIPIKPNQYLNSVLQKILKDINECQDKLDKAEHAGMCGGGAAKQLFFKQIEFLNESLVIISHLSYFEPLEQQSASEPVQQVQEIYCTVEISIEDVRRNIENIMEIFGGEGGKEIIKEVTKEKEIIKEVPVEKIVYVEKIVERRVEIPKKGQDKIGTGLELITGLGQNQDIFQGITMIESEKEMLKALYILAQLYHDGLYVKKDNQKALFYIEEGIKKNGAESWYQLANLFEDGLIDCSEFNHKFDKKINNPQQKYIKCLQVASDMGSMNATTDLGYAYENGHPFLEQNIEMAIKYYLLADNRNFNRATNNLGRLYQNQNQSKKAFELISKAANSLNQSAIINQALCLLQGIGCVQNEQKALSILDCVQNFLNPIPLINYAYYLVMNQSTPEGYQKAYKICLKIQGYDSENSSMLYLMGYMYQYGLGVNKDHHSALKFYKTSAELGNPQSLNCCGDYYFSGVGMEEPDIQLALDYYKRASDLQNVPALLNLGAYYEKIDLQLNNQRAHGEAYIWAFQ